MQEELDDAQRVAEDAMQEAANKEEQLQLVVTETESLVGQVRFLFLFLKLVVKIHKKEAGASIEILIKFVIFLFCGFFVS